MGQQQVHDPEIRVLVVDDERPIRFLMEKELPRAGCLVTCAESGEDALERLRTQEFDVVLMDLKMPGMGGLEALRRVRESGASAEVVVLTGHPDVTTAIEAMKLGAYDYLTKPFKLAEVEIVLRRAAERRRLTQENTALRRMVAQRGQPPLVLGHSRAMAAVLATVERIAAADANVLIEGESGTGKGLIAQTIHQQSPRSRGPLLAINCSGFQDQLLESELFGHEKGAFTGAVALKQGLFEVADRGTLFLDEVAEMSPAMQAKLLQVLDSREFRRVGGTRLHRVDVRVVAATNKSMQREVESGRFREDLYYRLNVVNILVPPLRERREDIPVLVEHFLARFQASAGARKALSPEALQALVEYPWPGNVRELSNIIERLVILTPGGVIGSEVLPPNIRSPRPGAPEAPPGPVSLAEMERLHIARVLQETGGKKMQAARLLAIDLKTLNKKMRDYHIALPSPR
ncbi:MAG: putative response regulator in two-component reguatory system, sigma54 dependent transcriptional [candidate division NC10 bacterium]|jgi:DNA-binding NtrC family response regulator|nr:putative response regulator in two-component reguatory system, sigma54 dependent transcriptional [candidate division NC10 bacterium]MBP2672299.1 putative response regulator in two-component reguatory system, sigma54 dependent transcriptional [candidate division NC10 bacterium]